MRVKEGQILAVECNKCGAKPRQKCELNTGQPRAVPHRNSRLAAKEKMAKNRTACCPALAPKTFPLFLFASRIRRHHVRLPVAGDYCLGSRDRLDRAQSMTGVGKPTVDAINRLALAGERAGFSIEQMIELLLQGFTVENLLCLIEWRLSPPTVAQSSSRWVM